MKKSKLSFQTKSAPKSAQCPICFEKIESYTNYRCRNEFDRCEEEHDHKLSSFFGLPPQTPFGRVFTYSLSSDKFDQNLVQCESCDSPADLICSECHSTLPVPFPLNNPKNIIVFGPKNVGKSTYLASLFQQLGMDSMDHFGCTFESHDEATDAISQEAYMRPIFGQRTVLPTTRNIHRNPTLHQPMIFRWKTPASEEKNIKNKTDLSLSFFDMSGEDFETRHFEKYHKKFQYADGFLFFVNTESLLEGGYQNTFNLEAHAFLNIYKNLPKKPPVAIILPKLDEFVGKLPRKSIFFRNSLDQGVYDLEDGESLSYELQGYLSSWLGSNATSLLRDQIQEHRFFALSSLGCPPNGKNIDILSPHRVMDPLAWLKHLWQRD